VQNVRHESREATDRFPVGDAPTELVITDLVVGDGDEAHAGSTVDVHYVGVEYDTGEEFRRIWNAAPRSTSRSSSSSQAGRRASPA
jgi:FKBP-type peptidyl-prolyl cis-trans isomerase